MPLGLLTLVGHATTMAGLVVGLFPTKPRGSDKDKHMYGYRSGYANISGYHNISGADGGALKAQQNYRRSLRSVGVGVPTGGFGMGPQLQTQPEGPMRYFPMGFLQAAVGKSATANAVTKPQVIFRGERLIVPVVVDGFLAGGVAGAFTNPFKITAILVGQRSQFVAATQLTAALFIQTAIGVSMELDTASIGQDITVTVLNSDAAATHDFEAAMLGDASLPA